jgi:PncC family amidohydrolase
MTSSPDQPDPGLVRSVLDLLGARALTLAVAEGDTGGVLLEWLTAVPGSSAVVIGGIVAYADSLKVDLLGVDPRVLQQHGAVSAEAAEAMAAGARRVCDADIALATTGIAGPGGATATKPVGLAFVAVSSQHGSEVRQAQWRGDRSDNRAASARAALELLLDHLNK